MQTYIDYDSAELVARYLASKRPFSQSFDTYLKHVSTQFVYIKYLYNLIYILFIILDYQGFDGNLCKYKNKSYEMFNNDC